MQSNKSCKLVEQYLNYLTVIKCRAENTIKEYRTDILMFFVSYQKLVHTHITTMILVGLILLLSSLLHLPIYIHLLHIVKNNFILHQALELEKSFLCVNFGST